MIFLELAREDRTSFSSILTWQSSAHMGLEILEVTLCVLLLTATGMFVSSIQPAYEYRCCVSLSYIPCIIDDPDFVHTKDINSIESRAISSTTVGGYGTGTAHEMHDYSTATSI